MYNMQMTGSNYSCAMSCRSKAMHVVTSLIALANTARTLGDKEALRELVG